MNTNMSQILTASLTFFLNKSDKFDVVGIMNNFFMIFWETFHLKSYLEPIFVEVDCLVQSIFSLDRVVRQNRIPISQQNDDTCNCIPHHEQV